MLGASGDTQIVLKTNQERKPKLTSITFPQWSAANFRIMHTLIKEGALSSTTDVMNNISYDTKVSELAKIYPIARVVQYDDLHVPTNAICHWLQVWYRELVHLPASLKQT